MVRSHPMEEELHVSTKLQSMLSDESLSRLRNIEYILLVVNLDIDAWYTLPSVVTNHLVEYLHDELGRLVAELDYKFSSVKLKRKEYQ